MFELKKLRVLCFIVVGLLVCWLCLYLPSQDRGQQYNVINEFYSDLFNYDYVEGDSVTKSNEKGEQILEAIKPYLAKETLIDQETIAALVVKPAIHSQVDLSFKTIESFDEEAEYSLDGKHVYQFDVTVSVISRVDGKDEVNTTALNMYVQLVREKGGWKVHSLEYFSNDLLYEN